MGNIFCCGEKLPREIKFQKEEKSQIPKFYLGFGSL
jgi:hypothetical protein